MSKEYQPVSTQEFADRMYAHRTNQMEILDQALPAEVRDLVEQARIKTRASLNIKPEDLVVLFGEQTYGLNENPKVIGKRIFAEGLKRQGATALELFASYDMVGSEGGIYRMQIPHPNSEGGFVAVNMLPGWKRGKFTATTGFRSPTVDELATGFGTLKSLYGGIKSDNLRDYLKGFYDGQGSYAEANIGILREFEKQIGLEIDVWTTEDQLDTRIAKNGGMEVMLYLWPKIVEKAQKHPKEGVRIPEADETPFHTYHTNDNCYGRMESRFLSPGAPHLDTQISSKCMQCNHSEVTNPQEIVDSGRPITWRAIPRVVAYSTLGIADGHVTGGGSIYNETAENSINGNGLTYFPITHMSKSNSEGRRLGTFHYQSSAYGVGRHAEEAKIFVQEGRAAMADLVLSIGVNQLKNSIEETLEGNLTTQSRVECPDPLPKYLKVIEI